MSHRTLFASLLATAALLGGPAFAADQATSSTDKMSPAEKAVDQDIGKLSSDGAQAFRNLHMARIAIFDAQPAQAKTLIGKAQADLSKAKTDEAVFTKAEADLKPPASGTKAPTTAAPSSSDNAHASSSADASTKQPVAWLPVDGQIVLDDDFVATPQKSAAMSDANKTLAKGDQKGAVEKLKLAGVNVNFTVAVLPLAKTTDDVNQAATLIDQGKYYEANAILKQAEDGMRFDMIDTMMVPQSKTKGAAANASQDTTGSTTPAKPAK